MYPTRHEALQRVIGRDGTDERDIRPVALFPVAATLNCARMGTDPHSPFDLIETLERFVAENDDLMELEGRIGRFNIFDALAIARTEIRHSNFLAWLLDPSESHGQGDVFLKAILMDLLQRTPRELRTLSPVALDGVELSGVDVRREWKNIDLLITCVQPPFVIAIENKLFATEHSAQLRRYKETVAAEFSQRPRTFVFLTRGGDEPSEEGWIPYSYADIHRVLGRCRHTHERSMGNEVLVFLDHYIRLIGSRFMDDPEIDVLCQRIYRNHKQALDLIFERVTPGAGILADLVSLLAEPAGRWHIFKRTTQRIVFVPESWLAWLPLQSALPRGDGRAWITWELLVQPDLCRLSCAVGRCKDTEWRRRAIQQLVGRSDELGFKRFPDPKKIADSWTTLFNEVLSKWDEDEEPDSAAVVSTVRKKLDHVFERMAAIREILAPILPAATMPASGPTTP